VRANIRAFGGKGSGDFGPVVDGGVVPDQPRTLFFIGAPPVTTETEYQTALPNAVRQPRQPGRGGSASGAFVD
jgi:hypothetical protein